LAILGIVVVVWIFAGIIANNKLQTGFATVISPTTVSTSNISPTTAAATATPTSVQAQQALMPTQPQSATVNTTPRTTIAPGVLSLNQPIQTNFDDRFVVTLERIELLSNSRMRWYFTFWNQGKNTIYLAFTDDNRTYVTSEQGKLYKFTSQKSTNQTNVLAGAKIESYWLELEAPAVGVTTFRAFLNNYYDPKFPDFEVFPPKPWP